MPQTAHRSTSRVLDVFDLLANAPGGYTLTEIARTLNSPKSSMLPILQTLAARNYIQLKNGRYYIGPSLYFAASVYRKQISVNKFIDMEMHRLAAAIEESAILAVREVSKTRFIHMAACADPVYCQKSVGQTEDGPCGALGKALLCDFKLDELAHLVAKDGVRLPDPLNLYQAHVQMEEARVVNIAYESGEIEGAIHCVASPIRYEGTIAAALGIILPTFRLTPRKATDAEMNLRLVVQKIENVIASSDEDIHEIFSLNGFRNL